MVQVEEDSTITQKWLSIVHINYNFTLILKNCKLKRLSSCPSYVQYFYEFYAERIEHHYCTEANIIHTVYIYCTYSICIYIYIFYIYIYIYILYIYIYIHRMLHKFSVFFGSQFYVQYYNVHWAPERFREIPNIIFHLFHYLHPHLATHCTL